MITAGCQYMLALPFSVVNTLRHFENVTKYAEGVREFQPRVGAQSATTLGSHLPFVSTL